MLVPMGDAARKLLEAGLRLSQDERLDVASALWASVDREPDTEWEAAWAEEVERRLADPAPSVSWDEARERLHARLRRP
jgi:putative addiction module component (TIGR02574 family)